jgi:hypothetical protein
MQASPQQLHRQALQGCCFTAVAVCWLRQQLLEQQAVQQKLEGSNVGAVAVCHHKEHPKQLLLGHCVSPCQQLDSTGHMTARHGTTGQQEYDVVQDTGMPVPFQHAKQNKPATLA